jgi:hypothetical protein
MLVVGTIGTAITLGARWLTGALPWAGLVIGAALLVAGLAVLSGRSLHLPLPVVAPRRAAGGLAGDLLFGVGYGTASLSCTLPIFLAATGTALTGSLAGSALSFLAYAAGMGTVLTALAVAAALSRSGLALGLRRLLPYVGRASGALLVLAGAYVVYYWAFFLLPGSETRTGGREVIDEGQKLASRLAGWLGGSTGQAVAEAVLAAVALLLLWLGGRRLLAASGRRARWEGRGACDAATDHERLTSCLSAGTVGQVSRGAKEASGRRRAL